jgi:hypothetical protein
VSEEGPVDASNDYDYLGEALDALDRLYDGESKPRDVQAILKLAGLGLANRELGGRISDVADRLLHKVQASRPAELDDQAALQATDEIRIAVAEAWAKLDFERNPHHQSR